MDPCPFVRLTVRNLALRFPVASKPASSLVHPTSTPCFCKIKLSNFPIQTASVPFISPEATQFTEVQTLAASFHLSKADLHRLASRSIFTARPCLMISIYTGGTGSTCGISSGRLLGKISVALDLEGTDTQASVFHNGWITLAKCAGKESPAQFHLNVKAEPDPRFVFQFEGEPECSPLVFQVRGSIRQPVFSCKFSFRNSNDRTQRSRSLPSEISGPRSWLSSLGSERERPGKERKGWSLTVHDLSGSPVAAASVVTPFVASPGSDRVSRLNPGSWLILRPGEGTWKPWGRLEAWRERGDAVGYRFELTVPESAAGGRGGIVLAESSISSRGGGKFVIDLGPSPNGRNGWSPARSPRGSGDLVCGFVMAANVKGEGRNSKPSVEVSVQHVSCAEDAAAYVALAAAVDLSVDACSLFSHRLRKELCNKSDNS